MPITDFDAHQAPPLFALPPAGETFTEPTFGTDITVLWTGTVNDPNRILQGSGWKYGWMSYDDTAIISAGKIFLFDPVAMKTGPAIPIPSNASGSPSQLLSATRGVVYITTNDNKLYEWDWLGSASPKEIYDFTAFLPAGVNMPGWNIQGIAGDDSRLLLQDSGSPSRILVFDLMLGKVIWQRDSSKPGVNYLKPWLDTSGLFCAPFENNIPLAPIESVDSGLPTWWTAGAPDEMAEHNAQLTKACIHFGGIPTVNAGQIMMADLVGGPQYQFPLTPDNFGPGPAGYLDGHCRDESWALTGSLAFLDAGGWYGRTLAPGQGEIWMFRTDGATRLKQPGSIIRFCHVRATYSFNDDYWNRAHPSISRSGRFICWSTNWENPNPSGGGNKLWTLIMPTGVGPFTKPATRPLPAVPLVDMRTPVIGNDAWAGPGQTRGPSGTQYAGLPKSDGSGWNTEAGFNIGFAISGPAGKLPPTCTPDGHYTIPADATSNDVYHRSCIIAGVVSDPSTGLVIIGNGPTGNVNNVPASVIPPPAPPPDPGDRFPPITVPAQTVLNPQPPSAPTTGTGSGTGATTPSTPSTPTTPATPATAPTFVAITPSAFQTVAPGGQVQFKANMPVVWSLTATGVGTIDANGLYMAPQTKTRVIAVVVATDVKGVATPAKNLVNVVVAAPTAPPQGPPVVVSPPVPAPTPASPLTVNDPAGARALTLDELARLLGYTPPAA